MKCGTVSNQSSSYLSPRITSGTVPRGAYMFSSLPLIVIVGPTAVGKNALMYRLIETIGADRFEIINGDSIQHYRELSIGSAKPSRSLRARYRHHLIDVLHPTQPYSVAAFVLRARLAAEEVVGRGRIPVLCGGSIYFILHLLRGLPHTPPPCPRVRSELQRRADREGVGELYRELVAIDPEVAGRIARQDRMRIVRALEIHITTGALPSRLPRFAPTDGGFHELCIPLTAPHAELRRRVVTRLHSMLAAGLAEEVRRLVDRGYGAETPALRAIGYRQFFHTDGRPGLRAVGEGGGVEEDITRATMRYAKHQLTFMRQLAAPRWYEGSEFTTILRRTRAFLHQRAVTIHGR